MNLEEYKEKFTEDDAPGWLAIDEVVEKLYPDQKPKHWAATPHYAVGGSDPIDGISFYEVERNGERYYHFVTYGFSNLYYDEESVGEDFSKFGFELTFRLKPFHLDEDGPTWVFHLIQNIARYVFKSGKWFEPGHYMPANGPIRLKSDTKITGIAFALDPELGEIDTPHGHLQFLQMYGITDAELSALKESGSTAEALLENAKQINPLLLTDLERIS
ncbi:SUFU family protein [Oleiphilus messinensis]|uniref:SUFU family protein n=1 Tax=Oleiphilus messinensis TaxID=141451 RepID=A0A1Y0ICR9_9GAMM|nr:suppressor of fused domain protein [Oleiphilus messinensis]ARU58328.1 SUFU family protein [Oleiphilus messinensis]